MGIRKRKPVAAAAKPQPQPQPIDRAFAAEVRRRAEKLAEPVEILMENGARLRQRQQAERQMAELRSEAVRARRLAEHIENLSQETAAYKHKWKHTMTDSTIVDPGHKQRLQRRADDKSGSSGSQLNFNPLHPSMELPPEQLIRLLGMESKKIRKSRKTHRSPKQAPAATLPTADDQADATPSPAKPQPQSVRPVDRSIQYEHCEPPQVFDNGRSGLLMPSLLVGVVAGIAISGYLFWHQPEDVAVQKAPAPAVVKKPQKKPLPKSELVKRIPATKQKMTAQEEAAWQASVEAREQRLRATAKQRLAERTSQQQVPRQGELQDAPVSGTSPVPAAAAAIAPEPVSDIVSPVDVTVAIEAPEVPQSQAPVEVIQPAADTLSVTPGETTAAEPAPVEDMPTTDNIETEEILDIEPAAAPAVADIEPDTLTSTETDPVLTPVAPVDESPAASAVADNQPETPMSTETDPALTPAAPVDESPVAPADDQSF